MSKDLEVELQKYLDHAAIQAGVSVTELLYRVLHVDPMRSDNRFSEYFAGIDEPTRNLLAQLDYRLKVLNPGLHYVYRSTYLGYRREDNSSQVGALGQRSQIFVSVVRRSRALQVVLPLNPRHYENFPRCRDMAGIGHQGVGDLQVEITDVEDLELFLSAFSAWLYPSSRA